MTYDRTAIMRTAWKGLCPHEGWHFGDDDPWTWPRCVRFVAAQAKGRRPSEFAAVEAAIAELLSDCDP